MIYKRYCKVDEFRLDVMPLLLEDEAVCNLPISILNDTAGRNTQDWFMCTVTDGGTGGAHSGAPGGARGSVGAGDSTGGCGYTDGGTGGAHSGAPGGARGGVGAPGGRVLLIALCTKPFNMLLHAPGCFCETPYGDNEPCVNGSGDFDLSDDGSPLLCEALRLLASGLRGEGFKPPGVLAPAALARGFYRAYTGSGFFQIKKSLIIMRLDELQPYTKAPGACRVLTLEDMSFVPYWEREFNIECGIPAMSIAENTQRILTRIGKDNHYIWVNEVPVSQAVYGRETPNGAVITWVYTPPPHRGRGYATSVTGELAAALLSCGKRFCCLFADAANPYSRSVYKKLGFKDACEFCEIVIE